MDEYFETLDELDQEYDVKFTVERNESDERVAHEQSARIQEFDISGRILEGLGVDKDVIDFDVDDDVTVRVYNIPGTNVSEIGIRA